MVKSPFYEGGIKESIDNNKLSTSKASNLFATTISRQKYKVDDFPTLSELNDELRGRPEDSNVFLENTVQQGAEQLNIFNSCNSINDMSIKNNVEVHTATEDTKINPSIQRPNSVAELMAKIINPNFGNLFFIK